MFSVLKANPGVKTRVSKTVLYFNRFRKYTRTKKRTQRPQRQLFNLSGLVNLA